VSVNKLLTQHSPKYSIEGNKKSSHFLIASYNPRFITVFYEVYWLLEAFFTPAAYMATFTLSTSLFSSIVYTIKRDMPPLAFLQKERVYKHTYSEENGNCWH